MGIREIFRPNILLFQNSNLFALPSLRALRLIFSGLLPIEWVEKDRNNLRPGGASRAWRDRISGNNPDSRAIAWVPRGTCPRSPCGKPNPCSDPAHKIRIRREPMKEQPLHYVPPGAGCAPGAPPESSPPWQWAYRPMENPPKSPTRLGEEP